MKVTAAMIQEQREYCALCDEARKAGIPVNLDNAATPRTVAVLRSYLDDVKAGKRYPLS